MTYTLKQDELAYFQISTFTDMPTLKLFLDYLIGSYGAAVFAGAVKLNDEPSDVSFVRWIYFVPAAGSYVGNGEYSEWVRGYYTTYYIKDVLNMYRTPADLQIENIDRSLVWIEGENNDETHRELGAAASDLRTKLDIVRSKLAAKHNGD